MRDFTNDNSINQVQSSFCVNSGHNYAQLYYAMQTCVYLHGAITFWLLLLFPTSHMQTCLCWSRRWKIFAANIWMQGGCPSPPSCRAVSWAEMLFNSILAASGRSYRNSGVVVGSPLHMSTNIQSLKPGMCCITHTTRSMYVLLEKKAVYSRAVQLTEGKEVFWHAAKLFFHFVGWKAQQSNTVESRGGC